MKLEITGDQLVKFNQTKKNYRYSGMFDFFLLVSYLLFVYAMKQLVYSDAPQLANWMAIAGGVVIFSLSIKGSIHFKEVFNLNNFLKENGFALKNHSGQITIYEKEGMDYIITRTRLSLSKKPAIWLDLI